MLSGVIVASLIRALLQRLFGLPRFYRRLERDVLEQMDEVSRKQLARRIHTRVRLQELCGYVSASTR